MAIAAAMSGGGSRAAAAAAEDDDGHAHDLVMPGFRFHPTEEELIDFYLRRKVEGKGFNVELITFLDLYRYDPWELPGVGFIYIELATIGEKEWFFYVPRDRKYRNGDRPNRVTTSGYWKATGADRMIKSESSNRGIGLKKTLVFYTGKAPKGVRTSWIMNEYRLPHHTTTTTTTTPNYEHHHHHLIHSSQQRTEISLCRVYKRAGVEDHHCHLPAALNKPSSSSRPTAAGVDKKHPPPRRQLHIPGNPSAPPPPPPPEPIKVTKALQPPTRSTIYLTSTTAPLELEAAIATTAAPPPPPRLHPIATNATNSVRSIPSAAVGINELNRLLTGYGNEGLSMEQGNQQQVVTINQQLPMSSAMISEKVWEWWPNPNIASEAAAAGKEFFTDFK